MPKWGLTADQAEARPWGLDPDLLAPSKTNTDPVWDEIYVNELERLVVDSPTYQRLRRVRQLGTTHLVYPGATHTRFQHSLGTLRVAQNLLDEIFDNSLSRRLQDDLVYEWRRDSADIQRVTAEATVLARLGALMHDFCHVPFGHTLEDDFQLLEPHDQNTARFEALWAGLDRRVTEAISPELLRELKLMVLPHAPGSVQPRYPFVLDLVGNTICADLIDYLWRDFYFTGLPGRLGQRFLSYFYITGSNLDPPLRHRMALRIEKNGRLRADVVSEVFKYLRYRYELGERALQHHAKISADAMIAKAAELWIKSAGIPEVERNLRTLGDDSILETLASTQIKGASRLAAAVRDRQLYRLYKMASRDKAFTARTGLYDAWKADGFKEQMESSLARAVGLRDPWQVLVVVPNPTMRLKAADVLVSWGGVVSTLREWDSNHGRRAQEIYESHERLWAVQLFVDRELSQQQRDRAAAVVSEELRVEWDPEPEDESVPPMLAQALRELGSKRHVTDAQRLELVESVHRTTGDKDATFDELVSRLQRQHDAMSKESPPTKRRRKDQSDQLSITQDHE